MKRDAIYLLLTIAAAATYCCGPSRAKDTIDIGVSFKIILNPVDGSLPPGVTDASVNATVDSMNAMLASYQRGYRIVQVAPVAHVGAAGDLSGPSQWYDTDFSRTAGMNKYFTDEAIASPALYGWIPNVVNFYVTNASGYCEDDIHAQGLYEVNFTTPCVVTNPYATLAGLAHHARIFPTSGSGCQNNCGTSGTGNCSTVPGDDLVADTLPDLPWWSQDNIAQYSFQKAYAALTQAQMNQVDDVYFNVMSYHGYYPCGHRQDTPRLTEGQLNHWADGTLLVQAGAGIVSGVTRFVDRSANPSGATGLSTNPYSTVVAGVANANGTGGDIVLIRPGAYNETLTLAKPVTLRAPRGGGVVIGSTRLSAPPAPSPVNASLMPIQQGYATAMGVASTSSRVTP